MTLSYSRNNPFIPELHPTFRRSRKSEMWDKNQDKVEQGFKFLKQPVNLGAVYTKKTERIEALGYIFLIVLLLAKYLEYRVRASMEQSGEILKVGGQKIERPTAKTII